MRFTLPVVWSLHGATYTGRLEAVGDRLTLTSRSRTFGFRTESISRYSIIRGASERIRGLPVLLLQLAGGETLRIASMGGAGSLHELAARVGGRHPAASGT